MNILKVKKPSLVRKWAICTACGRKSVIYDNTAECHGVFIKCQRGCKSEYELVIHGGKQIVGTEKLADRNRAEFGDEQALSPAT
ncbi:MAG: hypothetical protein RSC06_00785 [Clostridia bacterium]